MVTPGDNCELVFELLSAVWPPVFVPEFPEFPWRDVPVVAPNPVVFLALTLRRKRCV